MSVLAGRTPAALAEMFERPLDALDWMEKVDSRQSRQRLRRDRLAVSELGLSGARRGHHTRLQRRHAGRARSIKARALILAPPLDLFNPVQCAHEAADAIPEVTLVEIPSLQGHQSASSLEGRRCAVPERGDCGSSCRPWRVDDGEYEQHGGEA